MKTLLLTSKQPYGRREDGDIMITRALIAALADVCSVKVVTLSMERPVVAPPVELIEVAKPSLDFVSLIGSSVLQRRSLVHTRFAPPALIAALRGIDADVFVARRAYMAQALVDAGHVPPRDKLLVIVDALESTVLSRRHELLSPALKIEAARTRRDEMACLKAASQLAFLSDAESDDLNRAFPGTPRLDISLPPAISPATLDKPLAVFVGMRTWAPNADACRRLLAIWPRIRAQAPEARLLVVGEPARHEAIPSDPSIEVRGYVEDLDSVWRRAGVLLAPVMIGGGVRVKVLDAARHGVPVIGTAAAIGSASRFLPLHSHELDEEFIAAAAHMLADSNARREAGRVLYEANRTHHASGALQGQLQSVLAQITPLGAAR